MSNARKTIIFLAIAFIVSWGIVAAGVAAGAANSPLLAMAIMTAMMFGPAIAAVVCAFAFEKGRRKEALGLRFMPTWWWLIAWAIGILLAILSVAFTILPTDRTLVDIGARIVEDAARAQPSAVLPPAPVMTLIVLGSAATIAVIMNTPILTFSEELGWRGYLYYLWRPSGFWKSSLATGLVWGIWHAPAIWFFGLNYPEDRALGMPLFVGFCVLLSPLMALVRERGASVIAAGVLHGTINAMGGLTILAVSDASFPWAGIVGVGGFAALALLLLAIAFWRAHAPKEQPV